MASALVEATSVRPINSQVQRVTFEGGSVVDLPTQCVQLEQGERFKIVIAREWTQDCSCDCALHGRIYDTRDGFAYWSCGGLLAKLPVSRKLQDQKEGVIMLTRSRRRRRSGA